MTLISKINAIMFGCLLTFGASAQVPAPIEKAIHDSFERSLPSLQINEIQQSPIQDLYQVTSGPVVMYVTKDAQYAISGDILDLGDGETNLTEVARKKARLAAIEKLGAEHMIIYKAPNPRYEVTVFTDIDCAYCRKFHAQVPDMNKRGITVKYLAFPAAGKKSTSYEKAVHVWCSQTPNAMLNKAKQGLPVPNIQCEDHKIDEQFNLGAMAGVTGTPTIILDDGSVVPGYYDSENLLSILHNSHKSPPRKGPPNTP